MSKINCSVCNDSFPLNVRLVWQRHSDERCFAVCCACAESGKVNAKSVDNFPCLVAKPTPGIRSIVRLGPIKRRNLRAIKVE